MQGHTLRTHYSDDQKATALVSYHANGRRLRLTARELSIPVPTLQRWVYGEGGVTGEVLVRVEERGRQLSERLEELAFQYMKIAPSKMADASLRDLMYAIAIAIDKMVLLRKSDLPQIRRQMTPEEIRERLRAYLLNRVGEAATEIAPDNAETVA